METGRHEKQFQMWNRFLNMLLGAAIFGYFAAGWIILISFGLILEDRVSAEYKMLVAASDIVIMLEYAWALRKTAIPQYEMFP